MWERQQTEVSPSREDRVIQGLPRRSTCIVDTLPMGAAFAFACLALTAHTDSFLLFRFAGGQQVIGVYPVVFPEAMLPGVLRWTPKTGPRVKMDFRRSAE